MGKKTERGGGGSKFLMGVFYGLCTAAACMIVLSLVLPLPRGGDAPASIETGAEAVPDTEPEAGRDVASIAGAGAADDDTPAVASPGAEESDAPGDAPAALTEGEAGAADAPVAADAPAEPEPGAETDALAAPEQDADIAALPDQGAAAPDQPTLRLPSEIGPALELKGPALELNAVDFEAQGDLPLVAVILNNAESSPLAVETLLSLKMPLTIGIAPWDNEAIDLAAEARLAGYEVLAQLPIAPANVGSEATRAIHPGLSDVELGDRTEQLMSQLWMAVGASSLTLEGPPEDERIMRSIIGVLQRHGYAFLDGGDNPNFAAQQIASAFGVPFYGTIDALPADVSAEETYRALDLAAAAAQETGTAIVSGPPTLEMLQGLSRWGLERGGRAAQLAPVSAVVRATNAL